jgi:plasmid replication initiation protein
MTPKRTRAENKALIDGRAAAAEVTKKPATVLSPVRHPQKDFFVADILDVSIKDDLGSMEHPFFALKAGDMRVRTYERNGNTLTIKPGHDGCATIHDKDVWIYCISQLVEAMNRGREDVSRKVRFIAHDFLVTTNRQTSGNGYKLMGDALARLRGTSIETNIVTDGVRERGFFGLIDSGRVIEHDKTGKAVAVEVTLSDWLYRSVKAKQVLTLSPDYFRIRKPIDRRIYELARKHCGAQRQWQCTVKTLHEKSGSTNTVREFRRTLKTLIKLNDLPDYRVSMTDDLVTFLRK